MLDNLYDYCGFSNLQRLKRKLQLDIDELIIAIGYAFRCQLNMLKFEVLHYIVDANYFIDANVCICMIYILMHENF